MATMTPSPLESFADYIESLIKERLTNREIVAKLRSEKNVMTTEASVRRLVGRHEKLAQAAVKRKLWYETKKYTQPEGVTIDGDEITIIYPVDTPVVDLEIEDILLRRNLDPNEWEVKQILDNQWEANAGEGEKITLYQFKIWMSKKTPVKMVFPAAVPFDIPAPKEPDLSAPILAVVISDHQAPHFNELLHELTLRFLRYNQPEIGVIGGDLMDLGDVSRHRDDPGWDTSTQECINSGFRILYDYRQASLDTKWSLIKGNHDDRIRNEILERSERLYGITPAQWPGEEPEEWVYSLNHLLNLRRLGVEYHEPKTTYEFQQIVLSDFLAVRHGHKASASSLSGLTTAVDLGHSVFTGHTHKQSINKRTVWNSITGKWEVITSIETGSMCEAIGGLGYAKAGVPDWQPGFATANIYPDGRFSVDLATYEQNGILRWRDQVYSI